MNVELYRAWKKVVVVWFELLFWYLPDRTEDYHRYLVTQPRFELGGGGGGAAEH
jgi:hypothetical protein